MARVSFAALLLLVACAPSVPRPPGDGTGSDATSDRPSTIVEVGGVPKVDVAVPPTGPPADAPGGRVTSADAAHADAGTNDGAARELGDRDGAARDLPAEDGAEQAASDAAREVASDVTRDSAGDAADAAGDVHADADADTDTDADAGVSAARTPRAGDLRIAELLINPAGTDTSREWIEVVNLAPVALDLRLLTVADAANEVAVDAGVGLPGAILVLGQSLDPTRNGGAPVSFSFGNTISLNNAGDSIRLCLGSCADGLVLDQVIWTADLGAAYDGHAAIVGEGAGQFCPADQRFGTAASFGSPGLPNPPCGD